MTTLHNWTQGYDNAGNLTLAYSIDRNSSWYGHNHRLIGIYDSGGSNLSASFTYDALGRRIEHINQKIGGTTRYYYDGFNEVAEFDESDVRKRWYVHGLSYIDERMKGKKVGSSDIFRSAAPAFLFGASYLPTCVASCIQPRSGDSH